MEGLEGPFALCLLGCCEPLSKEVLAESLVLKHD